jgi:hypothetical protein
MIPNRSKLDVFGGDPDKTQFKPNKPEFVKIMLSRGQSKDVKEEPGDLWQQPSRWSLPIGNASLPPPSLGQIVSAIAAP